jgi:hypothetical protein
MLAYWLLMAICAAATLTPARLSPAARNVALFMTGAMLVVFIGGRSEVGCDWYAYAVKYLDASKYGAFEIMQAQDSGFGLLNWAFNRADLGLLGVNMFCAIVFVFGLMSLAAKQPRPWLVVAVAIPMLIVVVGMGFTRQSVAAGFLMLALNAATSEKIWRYLIFVALAATFHQSAIVFAPFVVFIDSRRALSISRILSVLIVCAALLLLSTKFEAFRSSYIGNSQWEGEGQAALYRMSLNVLAAGIFFAYRRRWTQQFSDARVFGFLSICSVAIYPFAFLEPVAADRISMYLLPFQIVVFARFPSFAAARLTRTNITVMVLCASAVLMFVWFKFANHSVCWHPYQNAYF